ncbi:hypothetical protein CLV92_10153 [Kineococcus xinjiangensis]|uniref:Uncharacterized protein n=1 Tax=Kineococcus xinjiangensis TaxID=512762 RepID=A0A2S6IVI2_9ACTN|nr:hypothetical protein [Kineococcus xinjiangensis]PPK98358.1 hypothetical protein CLV92_10153 [Kineococcus xinjiangensis]
MAHDPGSALPPAAKALADAITASVRAAEAGDTPRYAEAVARLATAEPEHVRLLLGSVVRSLLEELHPDGIDADDLREAVHRCARGTATWTPAPPEVDPYALVVLLAGALGVHPDTPSPAADEEESWPAPRPVPPAAVAFLAPLLLADLLSRSRRRLAPALGAAFAEIARAERMEMP